MQATLERIREGIFDMFPAAIGSDISPETLLGQIPDWDSMSSVNFKVYLEEAFGKAVPDDLLEGGRAINELIIFIKG